MKISCTWHYGKQTGYNIDNLMYSSDSARFTVEVGLDANVTRIKQGDKTIKGDSDTGKAIQAYVLKIIAPSCNGELVKFDCNGISYVE